MLELLAGAALRTLVLTAVVSVGLRMRRTRNPHVSFAAWTLVLAASLLMPVAMRLTPIALPLDIIPIAGLPLAPDSLAPELLDQMEAAAETPGVEPGAPPASPAGQMRWREFAVVLYLAVFGALMLRLLAGLALSWRIARAATPVRENWVDGLDVRVSRHIDTPAAFGSVILLPSDHAAWTPAKRLAVLAHEGAHVARRDCAIQLAATVNRAIFWFTPLSWWLRRHLSDLAEAASDDAAIARLSDRFGYAEILLEISGRVPGLHGVVWMARRPAVASRIERILSDTKLTPGISRRGRAMLAACIVPFAVSLSILIILPAPPPARMSLEEEASAAEEIVAGEAAAEGLTRPTPPDTTALVADEAAARGVTSPTPPDVTSILARGTVPRPPAATDATATPTDPAVPSPTRVPGVVIASPSSPSSVPPPARSAAAAREAPRPVPHPIARNALAVSTSRATRQPNRTAINQSAVDQSSGPEVVNPVAVPSQATSGPDASTGEDGQSPLFKRVVNESCAGMYQSREGWGYTVQARFFRGPGDAPWVKLWLGRLKPAELPVTVGATEIKFTNTSGTTYTLSPSSNIWLPPRYHRLTGSAENSSGGTIEFACGRPTHPL
jgi:beta-lactamase regulating signal transducer with metallopeptidase domain